MFKGIQKIKDLGVFSDYKQPAGIAEFGIKNLIYGWNYSGKTTLSRLFGILEAKKNNPDLPPFSFSIDTDQGVITEANYQGSPQIVRVFNSDFVTENLNFAGTPFKPILLLGAESELAQKEIERCENLAKRSATGFSKLNKAAENAKKDLDKAKTESAANIKSTISLISFFGSTQLDKELRTVGVGQADYELSVAALESDLKLARSSDQEQLLPIPKVTLLPKINELHVLAASILVKMPSLTSTIDHLVKNPLIENWIESGLSLHDGKTHCEFCNGKLDADRMASIKTHFSKDLADHKQEIQELLLKVESAKLSIPQRKEVEFYAQFRHRFALAQSQAQDSIDAFNKEIQTIIRDLQRKLGAPFDMVTPHPIDASTTNTVVKAVNTLNELIIENNKVTGNFSIEKAAAINRLKLHYAKKFAEQVNLAAFDDKQARFARHQTKYRWCTEQLEKEIHRLKAIISQAQRGREEINKLIETLLGSDSIQISVIKIDDQDHFQIIRRDGTLAKHLSEGEKTAVAFSFFLTKLNELQKPDEIIVYVDDPISSLDSNHIFQITALIKDLFFFKDGEDWKSRFKQVFFSTHNFEFFSLLRELKPYNKTSAKHYLVKRISPKESTLGDMPHSMLRYASEYHFLFDVLNDFHKAADKTDIKVLMLLPNAVRRFVELYTFAKYPGNKDMTVDVRADRIFGPGKSKRILKVLHYFSHANNIERIAENNDLICDIEGAVNELMELLNENDPLHMEALRAAINT